VCVGGGEHVDDDDDAEVAVADDGEASNREERSAWEMRAAGFRSEGV
jgi:hypothetical protein